MKKKRPVQFSDNYREFCEPLIRKGELTAKVYRHVLAVVKLDQRQSNTSESKTFQGNIPTSSCGAVNYRGSGLEVL
jgi:hypothetical protein